MREQEKKMKWKNMLNKAAACALAFAIVLGSGQIVTAAPTPLPADFTRFGSAYLINGNFDGTENFVTSGNENGKWYLFAGSGGTAAQDTARAHSGSNSVKIAGGGSTVDQHVELKPDTEYELSVWIYAEDTQGARVRIFPNGSSADRIVLDTQTANNGDWYQYTQSFTTGADVTYAYVGVVRPTGTNLVLNGNVWVDDFEIKEVNAPDSVRRTDAETIEVQYPDTRNTAPTSDEFSLSYKIGGGDASEVLAVNDVTWDSA